MNDQVIVVTTAGTTLIHVTSMEFASNSVEILQLTTLIEPNSVEIRSITTEFILTSMESGAT
jgi:hypothetical protein